MSFERRKRVVLAVLSYGASALHWLADIVADVRADVETWGEDDEDRTD